MSRIKSLICRNYTDGRPGPDGRQRPIIWGVFHTTADSPNSNVYNIANWWNNEAAKSSAHYIIGLDGTILQTVEEYNCAWHAANWLVNLQSIGVEHQDHGKSKDMIRTPELYESSAQLVSDIFKRHGVPIKLVEVDESHVPVEPGWLTHKQVSVKGTACPGGLNVGRIIQRALEISKEPGPEPVV